VNAEGSQRRALVAGVALVLVWGMSFSIQKAAYAAMGPGAFLFGRSLLMAACALAVLRWRGSPLWPPLSRAEWPALLGCTAFGAVAHILLVTWGIHWSTPFSSALIMACTPVFTLLILHVAGVERLSRGQVAGVAVACAGVLAFLSDKLLGRQWAATGGDLMMLLAASLFSYYTVMSKPLVRQHGSVAVMAYATLAGSPLLVLAGIPAALATDWSAVQAHHWGLFLWASLVSAFLGWLVWGWVNERRGVARTAPLQYLMPLVAGAVAWWATGERFSAFKTGAALLTLAGVAMAQLASRPAAAQDARSPVGEP